LRADSHFSHSRPQSSQGLNSTRELLQQSTPLHTPRDDLSAHDQYLLHQERQRKLDSLSDGRLSVTPRQQIDNVAKRQTSLTLGDSLANGPAFRTSPHLPKPLISHSQWKRIQKDTNFDSNNNNDEHFSSATAQEFGTQSISSPRSLVNGGLTSHRSSRMSQYPGLDSSLNSTSSAYARRKKELQTKMW